MDKLRFLQGNNQVKKLNLRLALIGCESPPWCSPWFIKDRFDEEPDGKAQRGSLHPRLQRKNIFNSETVHGGVGNLKNLF